MKTEILPKNHSRGRLQDEISACITEIPESLPSTIGKETPPHPMRDVQLENSVPSLLSDKIEEMSLQKTRDSEIAFPEIRLRWVRRQKKLAILSQDHHLSISPTILNREAALTIVVKGTILPQRSRVPVTLGISESPLAIAINAGLGEAEVFDQRPICSKSTNSSRRVLRIFHTFLAL